MGLLTLADVGTALRRFWALAMAILALAVGAGIAVAVVRGPTYQSTAALNVVPATQESFRLGGPQAVEFLVPAVLTRIESRFFEFEVRRRLPRSVAGAPISISATNVPGTSVVELEVESPSAPTAVAAARFTVERVSEFPRSDLINITILSAPAPAKSLTAERRVPIIVASVVTGLVLALLVAVAVHRLRPPIPRARDFPDRYGHAVLGEIPHRRGMPDHSTVLFEGEAAPEVLEAFRSLQTTFVMRQRLLPEGQARDAVAITSWSAGEGKTTVTANLAWALAASGRSVVVVDCDLRRPRVHELLGVSGERGVADIVRGASVASAIQDTAVDTLQVIAAGVSHRHPSDTVHRGLQRILAALGDWLILIDTPPLFAAETREIAQAVGGLVLVADVRQRRVGEIDEALSELTEPGTPVLGVVLNRVRQTDHRGELSYYYAPTESRKPAAQGG